MSGEIPISQTFTADILRTITNQQINTDIKQLKVQKQIELEQKNFNQKADIAEGSLDVYA